MQKCINFLHPVLLLPQLLHKHSPPTPWEDVSGNGGVGEGERERGKTTVGGGAQQSQCHLQAGGHKKQQSADDGSDSQRGREDAVGN
jgi:hypothetical protein